MAALVDEMRGHDGRGNMQLIQYNPIHHPQLAEFGLKVEGVSYDRDRIYGLATYYLAHGGFSYFGFGQHPYRRVADQWFKATEHDIGQPEGEYYVMHQAERSTVEDPRNLLANGGFEASDENQRPAGWTWADPIQLDSETRHGGKNSARITSRSLQINNINKQYVKLKPNTTYTLTAWIRTRQTAGDPGVQIYPYEFDGAAGAALSITVKGTSDWTRYRQTFTTGEDCEGRINFRMYGATGAAWFDDLQLVEGAIFTETVFARRFTKGLVLVRPYAGGGYGDDTASPVQLPEALRPLHADGGVGKRTTQITLRNGEAAILVR